ncbi:hypothetical protein [Peptostreptococcus sp. D1]|uniref:hypothetical protein n=1 Tax=Peptostreptococcus sp. D1 TaxID=72304 RepID=UPI0008DFE241|nr:hypothetical protein [Peptostreptococcus sp. D1]SFE64036.1 hypothetical protein SAMN02910278_01326 [Peptostreptococcus sp. D1]
MKESLKKITATFLALVLCLGIGANLVYANETFDSTNIEIVGLSTKQEPIELRSIGTKRGKTAIKWALRHSDDLVWQTVQDQLTHIVGRQAAIWIRMDLEWML